MNDMNRRSWLSWLGAFTAGTAAPVSALADECGQRRTSVFCIESFRVNQEAHLAELHAYLQGRLLPVVNQLNHQPKLMLEAVVAPNAPEALLLTTFASFDELLDARRRLAVHSSLGQRRSGLQSKGILDRVDARLMMAAGGSHQLRLDPNLAETGLFEFRTYSAPAWGEAPSARVGAAFARAGIRPLLDACTAVGEHLPQFTYLVPFANLAARQEAWVRLEADPDWIALQGESTTTTGSGVKVTEKSIYKLAPACSLG